MKTYFDPEKGDRREEKAVARSAFRWLTRAAVMTGIPGMARYERVLQQQWTIITYQYGHGYADQEVGRRDEWRAVPEVEEQLKVTTLAGGAGTDKPQG